MIHKVVKGLLPQKPPQKLLAGCWFSPKRRNEKTIKKNVHQIVVTSPMWKNNMVSQSSMSIHLFVANVSFGILPYLCRKSFRSSLDMRHFKKKTWGSCSCWHSTFPFLQPTLLTRFPSFSVIYTNPHGHLWVGNLRTWIPPPLFWCTWDPHQQHLWRQELMPFLYPTQVADAARS